MWDILLKFNLLMLLGINNRIPTLLQYNTVDNVPVTPQSLSVVLLSAGLMSDYHVGARHVV